MRKPAPGRRFSFAWILRTPRRVARSPAMKATTESPASTCHVTGQISVYATESRRLIRKRSGFSAENPASTRHFRPAGAAAVAKLQQAFPKMRKMRFIFDFRMNLHWNLLVFHCLLPTARRGHRTHPASL
ncbi:hypothetical protein [Zhengella mangrovi]|uniref:hypothetical protein n=1 Tax=Zhengella mangrovi TaxID=1982044 RepID=UPI001055C037|nr:hypothetical protein [Zhengella mangrovi]